MKFINKILIADNITNQRKTYKQHKTAISNWYAIPKQNQHVLKLGFIRNSWGFQNLFYY